jgi:hypothetical protein
MKPINTTFGKVQSCFNDKPGGTYVNHHFRWLIPAR